MKFTLSWLKQPLDTNASLDKVCETLTAIGLEVEDIQDRAALYAPFTVAFVEKTEPHPDADKLKLCTVQTAQGTFQVVCGAPNARAGMKGVFAPEGSYIPGLDTVLKKAKIRGIESCGMLVSDYEMMLSDESDGIIELGPEHEIGAPMADIFGLNEAVIEINLTPNRADCAGLYGIARDLAAAGIGTLRPVQAEPVKGAYPSPIAVKIEDTQGCPHFLGRHIRGVKNGPSPDWLQNLLKSIGMRPISALVDITNFVMLDHARPLHVYDADTIRGDIVVKTAQGGEILDALNDKTYTVTEGAVGICDDSGLIGLGGIVGGVSTGSTEKTVNIFLESACFDPMRIAAAGRAMGIISDARYRFERGIDPAFTRTGMELATRMILDICGGEASEIVEAGAAPVVKRDIAYDPAYFKALIGHEISDTRQIKILKNLGFSLSGKTAPYTVGVPSWRGDVEGKADLAEEIIRIEGFHTIQPQPIDRDKTPPQNAAVLIRTRAARAALAARGLNECVTWSFISADAARAFTQDGTDLTALTLRNPISTDMSVMRPSILPNLLQAAQRNHNTGYPDTALFETGPVFYGTAPDEQGICAAGIRFGQYGPRHWAGGNTNRAVDVYDAKADMMAALYACGAPAANAQVLGEAPSHYHPGRSGVLRLGKTVIARFGEIHPAALRALGVDGPAAGFEIFLDVLPPARKKGTEKPLLRLEPLQPLSRDFAFIVDQAAEAETLVRAAMGADKALISGASVFDVYSGKGVEDGKKSIALTVTIQPRGQTLSDSDLEALSNAVITSVTQKTGGTLRG